MKTVLSLCLMFAWLAHAQPKNKEILPVLDLCPAGNAIGANFSAAVSKNEIDPKRVGRLLTARRALVQDEDDLRDCLDKVAINNIIVNARKAGKISGDQADQYLQRIDAIRKILDTPASRHEAGLPAVSPKVIPASEDSSEAPATAPRGT